MKNTILNIFRLQIDKDRVFGLDLLRCAAIVFVVISHQSGIWPPDNWFLGVFGKLMGYDGVSIFFVLSGFLIGGILIKILEKNTINRKILINFWIRRWFRTLPAYFFILVVVCTIHRFFGNGITGKEVIKHFTFTQNIFEKHPGNLFPEAWSLSIEEWFYILIPIIVFVFIKLFNFSAKQSILFTAILVILIITSFRFYRYSVIKIENMDQWDIIFRKQVSTRLDSLMFGVLVSYIQFYHNLNWQKYKKPLLITGLSFFLIFNFVFPKIIAVNSLFNVVFSFTFISLATAFLLPFLSSMSSKQTIWHKTITYISLISYSLYLLNLTIVNRWIVNKISWDNLSDNFVFNLLIKNVSYWIILISLSILMYKYIEIPCTKLRDKFKIK